MKGVLACAVAFAAVVHLAAAGDSADYEIRVPVATEVKLGKRGDVSLTIVPAEGHSISKDAPLTIRLSVAPETGLKLPRARYSRRHAADAQAEAPRFDLEVEAETAGEYSVRIVLKFWVCRKKTCRPVSETRIAKVRVPAPPPPPPDAGPPRDAGPADA